MIIYNIFTSKLGISICPTSLLLQILLNDPTHCLTELLKGDDSIPVDVCFIQNDMPDAVVHLVSAVIAKEVCEVFF
jgi:hypothetical protein